MTELEEKGAFEKKRERLNADEIKNGIGDEIRLHKVSPEATAERPGDTWGGVDNSITEEEVKSHEKRRMLAKRFALFGLLFFVISVLIAGIVYWRGYYMVSSKNIIINPAGPLSVSAGVKTDFTLRITNKNSTSLINTNLLIEYPEGTREPLDPTKTLTRKTIVVGDIEAGGEKVFPLSATFYGEKGGKVTTRFALEYGVKMSNSRFNTSGSYTVSIDNTPISLDINMPSEITANFESPVKVKITSNSITPLREVSIKASYPLYTEILSAIPEGALDNTLWKLGTINPGETKEINLLIKAGGLVGEERTIRFFAGVVDPDKQSVILTQYAVSAMTFVVRNPFVSIEPNINGSRSDIVVAAAGSTVKTEFNMVNNLNESLRDASFSVVFDGLIYDEGSVNTSNGFYTSQSRTISWNRNTISELANIAPGSSVKGALDFRLSRENEKGLINQRNPYLTLRIKGEGTTTGSGGVPSRVTFETVRVIRISTRAEITAAPRFTSQSFMNVGPYPLRSETETTLAINLSVSNTLNNVKGAQVRATLPLYVTWKGNVSPTSADFRYDSITREVVWDIGNLNAGVGVQTSPLEAAFQIGVTPNASMVGADIDIVNSMVLTGKDEFTEKDIRITTPRVTSRLIGDPIYKPGYERVVP